MEMLSVQMTNNILPTYYGLQDSLSYSKTIIRRKQVNINEN